MRPNLALGPIDGIVQYLLYVSIVVIGVLLPLLIQKWRVRRDNARVLEQTLGSLRRELEANLKRVRASRESMDALGVALQAEYEHYEQLWHRVHDAEGGPVEVTPAPVVDVAVSLAAPTQTAWDVAQLSQSLRLLPPDQLSVFARAYNLHTVHGESRRLYLENALRSEILETPVDLANLRNIEMRLQMLAVTRAVVRYHGSLLATLITAYETALSESAASV